MDIIASVVLWIFMNKKGEIEMTNAWVLKTEQCGILGVYSSRRNAMIAGHEHLAQGDDAVRTQISDIGVNNITLSGEYDVVTVKRYTVNS